MTHGTLLVAQGEFKGTLYISKVNYKENKNLPGPEVLLNLLELSLIPLLLIAVNFRQVFFIILLAIFHIITQRGSLSGKGTNVPGLLLRPPPGILLHS